MPTPRQAFIFLALYFGIHVMSRTWVSTTAELDESEQLVLTQHLSWGYGSQPPLYAWIQGLAFSVFGLNVLALAVVKNSFLLLTYVFTYLNARLITRQAGCGLAAAFSLLFLPQIAWESQRDLTHSVLVTTLAAVSLFAFLRLIQEQKTWHYCAFGFCIGLGLLAKYNYAVFVLGLVLAALSLGQTRVVVLNRRILITLVIAAGLVLPHLLWAWDHPGLVFSTFEKFHPQERNRGWFTFLSWLFKLLSSTLIFAAPLFLVYFALLRNSFLSGMARPWHDYYERLIVRTLLIIFSGLVLAGLFFGLANFKERWFQPILICLPVLLVSRFREVLQGVLLKRVIALGGLVAVVMLMVVPGHVLSVSKLHRPMRLSAPFRELAHEIDLSQLPSDVVIAENRWMGGNLRLAFPEKMICVPEIPIPAALKTGPCLLVWNATTDAGSPPPEALVGFFMSLGGRDVSRMPPRYVEARYRYDHKRRMRLGLLLADLDLPKPR